MFSLKCLKIAALSLAAVGLGLAPTDAYAGGKCKSDRSVSYSQHGSYGHGYNHGYSYSHRSYDHGYSSRVSTSHRGSDFRVSFSVGSSSRHCDSRPVYRQVRHCDDYQPRRVIRTSSCDTPVVYRSSHGHSDGYWSQQYCPPIYQTRYRSCGTPYRVCVQDGYYKKVWVSFSH